MQLYARKKYEWHCRGRSITLGERTLVMGILNTTPDSFSDGGQHNNASSAVDRALAMVSEGATIIDIGGESTRPGADPVSVSEEIRRTIPVIEQLRSQSDIAISIDTMKAEVAHEAILAGANIVNDVSACEFDPKMIHVLSETNAGIILMHKQGSAKTMQVSPCYDDVVDEIKSYLKSRADLLSSEGINRSRIVIDPGIGFGKKLNHNLDLLRGIPKLSDCGYPILLGASRKKMIGQILDRDKTAERKAGSLGVAAWSMLHGAHILRVHDVIDTCDITHILDTICSGDV